jgi:hypothetical protein
MPPQDIEWIFKATLIVGTYFIIKFIVSKLKK